MNEDIIAWEMHDVSPTPSKVPWKRSMGLDCPHGLEFFIVNVSNVRNTYDSDFVQGGNGQRYRFCPKRELWIDDTLPEEGKQGIGLT